jgi:hypothetical protein
MYTEFPAIKRTILDVLPITAPNLVHTRLTLTYRRVPKGLAIMCSLFLAYHSRGMLLRVRALTASCSGSGRHVTIDYTHKDADLCKL